MFVDIIKAADLGWLATDNDQQSYLFSQTSDCMRFGFGRWWTFWALLCELGSPALFQDDLTV